MGKINIEDISESFTLTDFVILIFAALLLCLCWRLLKRWNRKKAFCYWFPMLMLIAVSIIYWAADHVDSRTKSGAVLEPIGFFVAGINFPVLMAVLICVGALRVLYLERLPGWISVTLAVILFWFFWHLVLHFMRTRALEKSPISLNLKDKSLQL